MPILSKTHSDPLIARLLRQTSAIDMDAVRELYDRADLDEMSLDAALIQSGLVSDLEIATAYSNHYLLPLFDPPDESFDAIHHEVAGGLSAEFCRRNRITPLTDDGTTLNIAIDCPDSLLLADEVRIQSGRQMRPLFATRRTIDSLLIHLYGPQPQSSIEHVDFVEIAQGPAWLPAGANLEASLVRKIDDLFQRALQMHADSIHLECSSQGNRLRFRMDGSLVEIPVSNSSGFQEIIGGIGSVCGIPVDDHHGCGRGQIRWSDAAMSLTIEVRCCPVVGGQHMVLQLQRDPSLPPTIDLLSMSPQAILDLKRAIEKPHGLILVCGPTGSGKAETMYACLREINQRSLNVFTVEESIRWRLSGVNQIQVSADRGITLHRAIELALEQDPDILLVNQIRDAKTAESCARAAAGGRMVFSTLAASRPASMLRHLESYGVSRHAIAETVRALVAQRRVRTLCDDCKRPHEVSSDTLLRLGLTNGRQVFQAVGCSRCFGTGYRGTETAYEIVRVDSKMADRIRSGEAMETITCESKRSGVESLKTALMEVAFAGRTSLAEVRRVL
jgi:type IV pilus assembly protein PilB